MGGQTGWREGVARVQPSTSTAQEGSEGASWKRRSEKAGARKEAMSIGKRMRCPL